MITFLLVVGLVTIQFLEWGADLLNLRALSSKPPAGLEDLYDAEKYARSQAYTRARTRFGFVVSGVSLVGLLVFWWGGAFGFVDQWVRGFGLSLVGTGLVYLGLLVLIKELGSLPFSIYSTFGLEARFGFNRTTVPTFILDRLKTAVLSVLIGGPILALTLMFFTRWGAGAWWWVWGVITVFSLLLQWVAPAWILPLFNKFKPLPEGPLRTAIFDYAKTVCFPLAHLFVMDGSRRSSKGNAFFSGFGRHKRIALFDTLIEKQSVPEMVAVLAHEIGHHKKKHIWMGTLLGIVQTGVMLFVLSRTFQWVSLFHAFSIEEPSVHAGLAVFGVLMTPLNFILSLPLNALSRRHEYEADRFAKDTLGTGENLSSALKKLSADSLSNLTPHPWYVALHYSHPPLVQRLSALKNF